MAIQVNTPEVPVMGSETFEEYHFAWLHAHPERSAAWLKRRLSDGFHIHHLDGDHSNNESSNLVLIEGVDHIMLHSGALRDGIKRWRKIRKVASESARGKQIYKAKANFAGTWKAFAVEFYAEGKPEGVIWSDYAQRLQAAARRYGARNGLPWPPVLAE